MREEKTMIQKLEKLVEVLIEAAELATEWLKRELGKEHQPVLPMPLATAAAEAHAAAVEKVVGEAVAAVEKKTRKPRAPKVQPVPEFTPEQEQAIADAPATVAEAPAVPTAEEMEESREQARTTARNYVSIAKNDTPLDGYGQLKKLLTTHNVAKITDLSHEQRLAFIKTIDGWVGSRE